MKTNNKEIAEIKSILIPDWWYEDFGENIRLDWFYYQFKYFYGNGGLYNQLSRIIIRLEFAYMWE